MMTDRKLLKWVGPTALLVFGMLIGWWINQPKPPWMTFDKLAAFYELNTVLITTDGHYVIDRECKPLTGRSSDEVERVIWRYEAIATDGQIAIYGPRPPAPSFSAGGHDYTGTIPLLRPINPDGWVVRILITCPGEMPETVTSPAARVQIRGD